VISTTNNSITKRSTL